VLLHGVSIKLSSAIHAAKSTRRTVVEVFLQRWLFYRIAAVVALEPHHLSLSLSLSLCARVYLSAIKARTTERREEEQASPLHACVLNFKSLSVVNYIVFWCGFDFESEQKKGPSKSEVKKKKKWKP
jgi:hypothetical protein